jgi:hypothetical protein
LKKLTCFDNSSTVADGEYVTDHYVTDSKKQTLIKDTFKGCMKIDALSTCCKTCRHLRLIDLSCLKTYVGMCEALGYL